MDWTGGVRRRFASGKSNKVLEKQKAHFAKVRVASQSTRNSIRSFHPNLAQDRAPSRDQGRKHNGQRKRRYHNGDIKDVIQPRVLSQGSAVHPSTPIRGRRKDYRPPILVSNKQRLRQKQPSVIYIGSSEPSSQGQTLQTHRKTYDEQHALRASSTHSKRRNEEDKLLQAKRRKLLARTDWLSLAPMRPLQIDFTSSYDRDRIGKRRKINNSATRKTQPAQQRFMILPFMKPLSPQEHMMNGPLEPDDMKIKIGTDALASQTQRSRRSHISEKTSLRPQSSRSSQLSEESMLLGAESPAFGPALFAKVDSPTMMTTDVHHISLAALSQSQMIHDVRHTRDKAEFRSFHDNQDRTLDCELVQQPRTHIAEAAFTEYILGHVRPVDDNALLPGQKDTRNASSVNKDKLDGVQGLYECEDNEPNPGLAYMQFAAQDTSKRLSEFPPRSSSRNSLEALKSSSVPVASLNSSSCVPAVNQGLDESPDDMLRFAPLSENGSAGSMPPHVSYTTKEIDSKGPSTGLQSRGTCFEEVRKLTCSPENNSQQVEEEVKNEAVWRQFIIGSVDSSEKPSQNTSDGLYKADGGSAAAAGANTSSAFAISGLGTSAKSTLGNTTSVSAGTTRTIFEIPSCAQLKLSPESFHKNRSMETYKEERRAANFELSDNIEDLQLSAGPERHTKNIHTAAEKVLNPNRFLKPKKTPTEPQRKPDRFHAVRRTKRHQKNRTSIYDLGDSDGMSIN